MLEHKALLRQYLRAALFAATVFLSFVSTQGSLARFGRGRRSLPEVAQAPSPGVGRGEQLLYTAAPGQPRLGLNGAPPSLGPGIGAPALGLPTPAAAPGGGDQCSPWVVGEDLNHLLANSYNNLPDQGPQTTSVPLAISLTGPQLWPFRALKQYRLACIVNELIVPPHHLTLASIAFQALGTDPATGKQTMTTRTQKLVWRQRGPLSITLAQQPAVAAPPGASGPAAGPAPPAVNGTAAGAGFAPAPGIAAYLGRVPPPVPAPLYMPDGLQHVMATLNLEVASTVAANVTATLVAAFAGPGPRARLQATGLDVRSLILEQAGNMQPSSPSPSPSGGGPPWWWWRALVGVLVPAFLAMISIAACLGQRRAAQLRRERLGLPNSSSKDSHRSTTLLLRRFMRQLSGARDNGGGGGAAIVPDSGAKSSSSGKGSGSRYIYAPNTPLYDPSTDSGTVQWPGSDKSDEVAPLTDWQIDPREIEIEKKPDGSPWCLGEGYFGQVYKAKRRGGTAVAVKVMRDSGAVASASAHLAALDQVASFRREIAILRACHDRHIVQFLGVSTADDGTVMLVTEFMEHGDLHRLLQKEREAVVAKGSPRQYGWYRSTSSRDVGQGGACERRRANGLGRRIALDVARGLAFLHARRIVHFDLKSPNILLMRDFTAKLADVGLSRYLSPGDRISATATIGTFIYAAPEVLLGRELTERVDIYSLGVVLWEISTGETPDSRRLRAPSVPDECPLAVAQMLERCLQEDAAVRPSAEEMVQFLARL